MSGSSARRSRSLANSSSRAATLLLVLRLGVLAVGQLHQRADAGERDRRVLPPRHVGEVVHGVVTPAELEEELVELPAEVAAFVAVVEGGQQLGAVPGLEQLLQRRGGQRRAAQGPQAAGRVDGRRREALQHPVGLGRFVGLHHLVVQVAERAARQQHEVDVAVDPPLVAHPLGQLVELGDQLVVGERRPVRGLQRDVLGDDVGLPLLLPRLADRRHLGGELLVVVDHPPLDLRLVGDRDGRRRRRSG